VISPPKATASFPFWDRGVWPLRDELPNRELAIAILKVTYSSKSTPHIPLRRRDFLPFYLVYLQRKKERLM
jgi:hypothetical protein